MVADWKFAQPSVHGAPRLVLELARKFCAVLEATEGGFPRTSGYLASDRTNQPDKCMIRTPSGLYRGHVRADVAAILGSRDILFGEIDRRSHLARYHRSMPSAILSEKSPDAALAIKAGLRLALRLV